MKPTAGSARRAQLDRRTFLRQTSAWGASAVALGILAGCSPRPPGTKFADLTAPPPPAARQGGVLTVGPVGDGGNYDPTTNIFDYPQMPLGSIFEGLTTYPVGTGRWTAHNLLATSLQKSSDGRVYRFALREGVQFHQGFGELTATDVKYSFERAAALIPLYPGAPADTTSYYATDFAGLTNVQVTSRYTGEIRFEQPFVPFETITMPFATSGWLVSQKAIEAFGAEANQNPVGTGPYEMVDYAPNSHMTLRRFADYHGGNQALGARNAFDEIQIVLTPSNARSSGQALTVPIESNEVDFTDVLGALDVKLLADDPSFTAYQPDQALNTFFLALDVQHPALADLRVRQAICCALDVEEINLANAVPASARLDAPVARQVGTGFWPQAAVTGRDVSKAKALLDAAEVHDLSLTIATPNLSLTSGDPRAVMQVIQSNLKDVGIEVEVIATAPDSFVTDPGQGALLWANFAGAPDPYYQLEWFTCEQIGVWNYAMWCDPAYGDQLTQLGTTTDTDQRQSIAVDMQRRLQDASALVFCSAAVNYSLSTSAIRAAFDGNGNPQLHYFYRV